MAAKRPSAERRLEPGRTLTRLRNLLRLGFARLETMFDKAFPPDWNPLYHLGALGFFFYWIVAVSGIYLYIFFDTGITEAYDSIEYLTVDQWYLGGVMRSLHRYASDAMILMMLVHGPPGIRAWPLPGCPLVHLGDRRADRLAGVRLRHHRLLAGLGPARPICRDHHHRMAGPPADLRRADRAQLPLPGPCWTTAFSP